MEFMYRYIFILLRRIFYYYLEFEEKIKGDVEIDW